MKETFGSKHEKGESDGKTVVIKSKTNSVVLAKKKKTIKNAEDRQKIFIARFLHKLRKCGNKYCVSLKILWWLKQ